MNYIVAYRREGKPKIQFFKYRDDIAYDEDTLIRDVNDVIRVMRTHYRPDNDVFSIRETLLTINDMSDKKILDILATLFVTLDDK